ncbi:RdgB/HAM1 family non-canonical purine NTP pyrophosphatase [bacterium]|nr:RdgB/HAM1 family non-canonical purine NTP pyrophosphatase [bacterium]
MSESSQSAPRLIRPLARGRIVAATHNPGKLRELDDLMRPLGFEPVSAQSLGVAEPEETGDTFVANAELKALASARATGLVALADDSGLAVDELAGAPGIFSARWAGPTRNFAEAMQKVEDALNAAMVDRDRPVSRGAEFVSVLCLAWPDGATQSFEGRIRGELIWPPRGDRGFGYDPMFVADGETETFGEMDPARKHAMSHRARAFAQLVAALE